MDMKEYNDARAAIKPVHTAAIENPTSANIGDLYVAIALHGLVTCPITPGFLPVPICGFISMPDESKKFIPHVIYPADQVA